MKKELMNHLKSLSSEELFHQLYKDHLTGLFNRKAFDFAKYGAVAIIDLDSLKYLNDHFGYRYGDLHLKVFAGLLELQCGSENCFRLSGDEFVVTSAHRFQLISKLQSLRGHYAGFSYGVGASLVDADRLLKEEKTLREKEGLRAPRGEKPYWVNLDGYSSLVVEYAL